MATALYAALCGLGLVFLSIRVIRLRREHHISYGHQGNADLERAMRVQANFVEYTPIALILLMLSEMGGMPIWEVHVFGVAFIVARVSHFIGFRTDEAPMIFRVGGMLLTFGVIALLSILMLIYLDLPAM